MSTRKQPMGASLFQVLPVWSRSVLGLGLLWATIFAASAMATAADRPPNFVIIYCDDK